MINYLGIKLKIRHGTIVENIVTNLCAKLNYDRLRSEKVLGNWKSDNNNPKNKNNVRSHWGPIPGFKKELSEWKSNKDQLANRTAEERALLSTSGVLTKRLTKRFIASETVQSNPNEYNIAGTRQWLAATPANFLCADRYAEHVRLDGRRPCVMNVARARCMVSLRSAPLTVVSTLNRPVPPSASSHCSSTRPCTVHLAKLRCRRGPLKMTDIKCRTRNCRTVNTVLTKITLRYNEVCSFWLLLFS